MASHDRAFLDATVTRIWELRDRRLTAFRGDYSAYHRQRVERDARTVKGVENQAEAIARERELVQRYRSHRKFSKMHEHEARLERLESERAEAPRAGRRLAIPSAALLGGGPSRSGEIVVRVEDLAVGYLPGRGAMDPDGRPAAAPHLVARAPFLAAQRGERIGIVGPNGAGKTTLLRTIAGDLPPLDGRLTFGNAVQIGYLAQLRGAAIAGTTVLDALLEAVPVTAGEARAYLARFLFRGDDAFKEVRALSGGERSRLELALLWESRHRTCCCSTNPRTTSTSRRERRSRRSWPRHRRRCWSFRTTGACSRRSATSCGSWAAERPCRSTVGTARGGRPWRAAGPSRVPSRSRPRETAGGSRRRPGIGCGLRPAEGGSRATMARLAEVPSAAVPPAPALRTRRKEKLSKEAYRKQKIAVEGDLTRLNLRKNHLELAMADPAVGRELRGDATGQQ